MAYPKPITSKILAEKLPIMDAYPGGLPYSFSRANVLALCPLQYEYKYRKKVKLRGTPTGNDDAEIGTIAHRIAEYTMQTARDRLNLTTVGGDYNGNFEKCLKDAKNDYQRQTLLDIKEPIGVALTELLLLASKGDYTLYTERELRFDKKGRYYQTMRQGAPRCSWRETGFLGYVDLEFWKDDELLIFDHKTEFPSDDRKADVERQMALYAFLEFESRKVFNRISTFVVYLKNAQIVPIATYDRATTYGILKNFIVEEFDKYIGALKSFEARKVKNPKCIYCDYQDICNSTQGE